jgi:hypothetical protein
VLAALFLFLWISLWIFFGIGVAPIYRRTTTNREGISMIPGFILWLLGVPLGLIVLLWLLGVLG